MVVYLVTNRVNDKQYVGQTIRPLQDRWRDHCRVKDDNYFHRAIRKYGAENFTVEIIDTAETLEELDRKEMYWISKLGTLCPHGYNIMAGGSVAMRGLRGMYNPKSKLIYQFRLDGSMVNGYWGASDAERLTGIGRTIISRSLKSKKPSLAGGYLWVFATEFTPDGVADKVDRYIGKRWKWKPVLCVETGEIFQNMTEAAKKYNTYPNSISSCCSGKLKTTGGYHWKYYEGE